MFKWRNALGLTVIFVVVAIIYWLGFTGHFPFGDLFRGGIDYSGLTMLIALGIAMGFGFIVLLRSSREL